MSQRLGGFTLLEMVGVTLLSTLVLWVAVDSFLDLSRQSRLATQKTRSARRTVATLDRLARDLSSAVLLRKPPERDPLEHPWLFLAEAEAGSNGAERIKFVTRSHRPSLEKRHESDLALVAYVLRPRDFEAGFELLRWTSPRLPEALDRSFPGEQDGARVLLEDVAEFSLRFQNEAGEWQESWDSSTLGDSSELPISVEIQLALLGDPNALEDPPLPYSRQVLLPLRPIDLEALLEESEAGGNKAGEDDEETDEDCLTVDQCRSLNAQLLGQLQATDPGLAASLLSLPGDQCFSEIAGSLPVTLENCQ